MITAAEARGERVPYTEADVDRVIRMVVLGERVYRDPSGHEASFDLGRWTDELTVTCERHGFVVKADDQGVHVSW